MSATGVVLVAEDSLVVRAVLREHLEAEGFTVVEATDGLAALESCRAVRPDAVLLDIEMPGLDGLEVLSRLKVDPDLCDIPVVFVTGRTGTLDMVGGLRAGAHDYLRKPFDEAELIARVGGAVRIKHLQDELRERNAELDRLSRIDGLTGVSNRRHIEELLRQHTSSSRRHHVPLAVLVLDLDHFKRVNDRDGHIAGDIVLREFATRLRAVVRLEDSVGRWGGEEFLVICPDTDSSGATLLAERIVKAVAETPVPVGDHAIAVTVSIGCASGEGWDGKDLLERADQALYRAKAGGRNRVVTAPTAAPKPAPDSLDSEPV